MENSKGNQTFLGAKSALNDIEKALHQSDIGINPVNDGKVIRLNFPQLTKESRQENKKRTALHQ